MVIKIAVLIWWWINDRRSSNKVTWSESIIFRILVTWKCFIGKIYLANILTSDISSNRLKNLVISDVIIVKSEIANALVIFSSTYCSQLTKAIFKWSLAKPFCQNIFDKMLQKKFNSFYDQMNCNFQMNGFLSNSCDWMLHLFIMSKKISINEQNKASGVPYDVNVLLTGKLNTWGANFTFMIEYGVNFIYSFDIFG